MFKKCTIFLVGIFMICSLSLAKNLQLVPLGQGYYKLVESTQQDLSQAKGNTNTSNTIVKYLISGTTVAYKNTYSPNYVGYKEGYLGNTGYSNEKLRKVNEWSITPAVPAGMAVTESHLIYSWDAPVNMNFDLYGMSHQVSGETNYNLLWNDVNSAYTSFSTQSGYEWNLVTTGRTEPINVSLTSQITAHPSMIVMGLKSSNESANIYTYMYNPSLGLTLLDVQSPSVSSTAPINGTVLTVGDSYDVKWTATDNIGVTSVEVNIRPNDAAPNWTNIATLQGNPGHVSITVPNMVSNQCMVQIIAHDAAGNAGTAYTNGHFQIMAPLAVCIQSLIPDGNHCNNGTIFVNNVEYQYPVNMTLTPNVTYHLSVNRHIYYPPNTGNVYHFMSWDDGGGSYLLRDIMPSVPTTYTGVFKRDVNLGGNYDDAAGNCYVQWSWGIVPPHFDHYALYHAVSGSAKNVVPTYELIYTGTSNHFIHHCPLALYECSTYIIWAYSTIGNQVGSNVCTIEHTVDGDPPIARSFNLNATAYSNGKKLAIDGGGRLHVTYTSGDTVFYATSADDGETWGGITPVGFGINPAIVLCAAKGVGTSAQTPSICYASRNSLYMTDQLHDASWSKPRCVYEGKRDEEVSSPSYVLNRQNNQRYAGWASNRPSGNKVYSTEGFAGGAQFTSAPIDQGARTSFNSPSQTLDRNGNLISVWSHDGLVKYSDPVEGTIELSATGAYATHPIVATYGDRTSVTWMEQITSTTSDAPARYQIVAREKTTAGWSDPQVISFTDAGNAQFPVAAAHGQYVYTKETGDGNYDLNYFGSYANNQETYTQNLTYHAGGQSGYPDVVFRPSWPNHKLYVVWTEKKAPSQSKEFEPPVVVKEYVKLIQPVPEFGVYPITSGPSPYTIQRAGAFCFGPGHFQVVDYDPDKLMYHFDNLDPKMKYQVKVVYYWPAAIRSGNSSGPGPCGRQILSAGRTPIMATDVPETTVCKEVQLIPKNCYRDGSVDISIEHEKGDYAICAGLELIAYEDETGEIQGGGQMMTASARPLAYQFKLMRSIPNPTTGKTMISYQIAAQSQVSLKIYNSVGQVVRTLCAGNREPGNYQVIWDGKDHAGKTAAAGVYFYRLSAGAFSDFGKLVMIK